MSPSPSASMSGVTGTTAVVVLLLVNAFFLTVHVSIVIGDQLRLFNHAAELQRGKNLNNKLSSDSLLTST